MRNSDLKKLQNSQSEIDHVVYADLFPKLAKPKSRERALSILHAAIESYRECGIENTTYERIAENAKISRPLIFKYFKDYDDIFFHSVKYIRVHFQFYAVQAIGKQDQPIAMLSAYIDSTFDWIENFPSYASGLLLYLQRCSWDERNRELNTHFVETGKSRIAALIRFGVKGGQFRTRDPDTTAKQIQTIIAGAMITSACERLPDKKNYQAEILDLCLSLVDIKQRVE